MGGTRCDSIRGIIENGLLACWSAHPQSPLLTDHMLFNVLRVPIIPLIPMLSMWHI